MGVGALEMIHENIIYGFLIMEYNIIYTFSVSFKIIIFLVFSMIRNKTKIIRFIA